MSELIISESTTKRSDRILFLAEVSTLMPGVFLHCFVVVVLGIMFVFCFVCLFDDQTAAVFFSYLIFVSGPNKPFGGLELNLHQIRLLLCMIQFSLHINLLMSRKSTACKEYFIQLPRK